MSTLNWKKEATKKAAPFLKKFVRKIKRKFRPDLDDIHDTADVMKNAPEDENLITKGLGLGLELSNPVTGSMAILDQARRADEEGSFINTALTKQPEIPAIGTFQIGHDPTGETDIGRRVGTFLASLPGRTINAYEDYQTRQNLLKNIATIEPQLIPINTHI